MNKQIKQYIEQNQACDDLIFRDWNDFLELLFSCGGAVKEILWFEYILIANHTNSLGGGGYRDIKNPDYMWAETMIYDKELEGKSLSEIKKHIESTINSYKPHALVPCFFDIIA